MRDGERRTTTITVPVETRRRIGLLKVTGREQLYLVLERLLDEHDARSRAATPTTPREEAVA